MENISSIQLFYAYYNDNFDLLKTLLREGIRINETGGKIDGLFLLNKKLSSIFEIKQYIELIKKDFNLLRCISCYHREEVYAELIKINPGFKCYIEQEKFFNRILSYPQYKEIFGYEFIANSNENQQHMLYTAESGGYIGCGKLKVLLDLNLNFYLGARDVISQKFLLNFGLERVAFLPLHQQSAFVYAFENNVVSTLEKILAINSEFKLDIGYSNKSVLIYPKIITLCGIQNIAFTTQEQQEELCDSYHKYFHYNSDYDKTHKIARYGQFKDTVNKVKTLTKNNSKLLDDKVGE
jgi:hypothetical protein